MSCYFRHIRDLLDAAGIEVSPANKQKVDQAIHQMVNVPYKDCPATWKRLKHDILTDEDKRRELVTRLRETA